jgi:hypothetical protein
MERLRSVEGKQVATASGDEALRGARLNTLGPVPHRFRRHSIKLRSNFPLHPGGKLCRNWKVNMHYSQELGMKAYCSNKGTRGATGLGLLGIVGFSESFVPSWSNEVTFRCNNCPFNSEADSMI